MFRQDRGRACADRSCIHIAAGLSLAAIGAVAPHAFGQTCSIYLYEVDKNVSYTQVSNLASVDPDAWYFHAGLFHQTPDIVTMSTLTFDVPPLTTVDLSPAGPLTYQYYSGFYNDQALMDADYPAVTYSMTATCEGITHEATVEMPADLFCAAIPHFTGTTYDRLQTYDVTMPFIATINGFIVHPGANIGVTAIAISQDMVGGVYSATLMPGETQFTVPAGTLVPGVSHAISVSYSCYLNTPNAGFGGASSDAAFSRGTSITFNTLPTVPPCPADFNLDGLVNSADFFDFLTAFFDNLPSADVNGDTFINSQDFFDFLAVFFTGC